MTTLTLGFSPCPNDTFIFDALVHQKIDMGGLRFEVFLEDVETLNQWAAAGRLDVTKLSFPALFANEDTYQCLQSGAALGRGVGPLLVSKTPLQQDDLSACTVAIPGANTTANLLLSFAYPHLTRRSVFLFSEIEDAVLSGKTDLGVLIHENRFTYRQKGLHLVADLGAVWESKMKVPIPLGCIAAKKQLPAPVLVQIETGIRQSLQHAWANAPTLPDYVVQHAQAMDAEVMRQHIGLYVNEFSLDLSADGNKAIETLRGVYAQQRQSKGVR